jgi:hypothetical protein
MVQVCHNVQVLHVCVGIYWYFWISTMYIPAHTNTYLHIVTYLQIVKYTECHYVVGI